MSRAARILLAAALLALPTASSALTFAPQIQFDGGSGPIQVNSFGTLVPSASVATWSLDAPTNVGNGLVESWTAQLKEDPFVTNNIVVTNTTTSTQTFIATVLLPIPAFAYTAVINSSVGVTVTDSNGDGVLHFANSGATPIYQGIVNAPGTPTTILSLNPPGLPLSLASCTISFPGCSATTSTGTAFLASAGVASSIAITLTFDLGAGDSAGLTSRFEIIPEPGLLGLAAAGVLGLLAVSRARS